MTEGTHPEPSLFEKLTSRIARRFHRHRRTPVTYQYKSFAIELPENHRLPEYQERHPKYDRFLPHLAKYAGPADTIVDIGANVGDTLAGMAEQNPQPTYICIEPDDSFHGYLVKNAEQIKGSIGNLKVETIKALVGRNVSNVALVGERGTKHAVTGTQGGMKSSPLDELIAPGHGVRILKSDVDGFDYDVLDSSMAIISRDGPMLFFECQYEHEHQLAAFRKTLIALEATGYRDWTLFDNFGEVLLRTADLGTVNQLLDYVWRQNTGSATRTIYYFDILAVRQPDSALIDRVLNEYVQPEGR
jgi:FkbM family methyltransferase